MPIKASSIVWGELYQTESDAEKMADFNDNIIGPLNDTMIKLYYHVIKALVALEDELREHKINILWFIQLLIDTARHESQNGCYTTQIGGGPASGYWQIEPDTAIDVVRTSGMYGPESEFATSVYREFFRYESREHIADVLRNNITLSALIAAMKYIQAAKHKGKMDYLR